MLDYIKYLLEFIFGTKNTPKSQFLIILIILIGLIIVDSRLGLTEHFYQSNKIKRISELNNVIKDTSLTIQQKESLNKMRDEILNSSRNLNQKQSSIRFYSVWYIVSYSVFYLFMIVILFFNKKNLEGSKRQKNNSTWSAAFIIIVLWAVSFLIAKQVAYLKNTILAYFINFFIQIFFIYILWIIFAKGMKAKESI